MLFQNAVAVLVENWTNQKLEFPELSQELGGTDRWYPPENVDKHTRYDNLFFVCLFRKCLICEQSLYTCFPACS